MYHHRHHIAAGPVRRRLFSLLALLISALILSSCGMSRDFSVETGAAMTTTAADFNQGEFPGEIAEEADRGGKPVGDEKSSGNMPILNPDPNRKLIVKTALELETQDFDSVIDQILNQLVPQFSGYVESSQIYNNRLGEEGGMRYAVMSLRIPTKDYAQVVTAIENLAHVVNRSDSAEDVTLTYVDTESHIKALETEEATLLTLLEQAESVEDIIAIQGRLTQVRYELEYYTSQLRQLDNLIDFSTLSLNIQEVRRLSEPEEANFLSEAGRRLREGWDDFTRGLRRFSLDVLGALPWIISAAVLIIVLLLILGALNRRSRARRRNSYHNPVPPATQQPTWNQPPYRQQPQQPQAPPQPQEPQATQAPTGEQTASEAKEQDELLD